MKKVKIDMPMIRDCNFVGVKFDAKAVNAIEAIATGLIENAKALGLLAQVLHASNVYVEALLKVESPKE